MRPGAFLGVGRFHLSCGYIVYRQGVQVHYILHLEPSLDALSLRSNVISSIKILSPLLRLSSSQGYAGAGFRTQVDGFPPRTKIENVELIGQLDRCRTRRNPYATLHAESLSGSRDWAILSIVYKRTERGGEYQLPSNADCRAIRCAKTRDVFISTDAQNVVRQQRRPHRGAASSRRAIDRGEVASAVIRRKHGRGSQLRAASLLTHACYPSKLKRRCYKLFPGRLHKYPCHSPHVPPFILEKRHAAS